MKYVCENLTPELEQLKQLIDDKLSSPWPEIREVCISEDQLVFHVRRPTFFKDFYSEIRRFADKYSYELEKAVKIDAKWPNANGKIIYNKRKSSSC